MPTSPPPIWRNFWRALKGVITSAWPEIGTDGHPIFRANQADRIAWRSQMDAKQLKSPWVVVVVPPASTTDEYGADKVIYAPRLTVFYIATAATDPDGDIAGYVTDK